jgi:nitric oxide reductase NorE protein
MTTRIGPLDDHYDLPEFLTSTTDYVEPPVRDKPRDTAAGRVPGEVGIWVFVLGDMTVFAVLLAMLMWQRRSETALIAESASHLMPNLGFFNTLVLLTSSFLVVQALHAHRLGMYHRAAGFIAAAVGCAALFASVKAIEYAHEIDAGHTPNANVFFNYYYALTGLHLLHVVIGSALLSWWWSKTQHHKAFSNSRIAVEGVATYWHMVDLLWIAIFTLSYLVCSQ